MKEKKEINIAGLRNLELDVNYMFKTCGTIFDKQPSKDLLSLPRSRADGMSARYQAVSGLDADRM